MAPTPKIGSSAVSSLHTLCVHRPFKKQYFKVCSLIQAIGESGGQVVMSDSAGSCAEGMSTSTKSSTGSGILTLTLKGSKRISLQLITLIESIQCKEIYLWTKKFFFFYLTDSCCKYAF